jgi:hypothetical protein
MATPTITLRMAVRFYGVIILAFLQGQRIGAKVFKCTGSFFIERYDNEYGMLIHPGESSKPISANTL